MGELKKVASGSDGTESVIIDNILDGKRAAEAEKKKEEANYQKEKLLHAADQKSAAGSIDSRVSKPIEELVGAKNQDPRKKNQSKLAAIPEKKKEGGLTTEALKKHEDSMMVNQKFFKQPQAVELGGSNQDIDRSIDRFFKQYCKAIVEEANSGPRKRKVEDFVGHYGKEHKGFLNYAEFCEIFKTHALPIMLPSGPPPEQGKLLALFSIFDT